MSGPERLANQIKAQGSFCTCAPIPSNKRGKWTIFWNPRLTVFKIRNYWRFGKRR